MEIKRTTKIFVETRKRLIIRESEHTEEIACPACTGQMLAVAAIAALLGISHRKVFRVIESGAAHFAETETGAVMICRSSFTAVLSDDTRQLSDGTVE